MNHTVNRITLVCYDISNNKFRRKIDKCMKDFGIRLQYSVFLCRLGESELSRCREKLSTLINQHNAEREEQDSLIIFEGIHPNTFNSLLEGSITHKPSAYRII